MAENRKSKDEVSQRSDYLSDYLNKIVVCETLSGRTINGILTEFSKYELFLVETKDIKSKKPKKTVVFKHGLVSIREME